MDKAKAKSGKAELNAALRSHSGQFFAIGLFSFFVNLLMLTGPLFMLQIYDRVLSSRSESTLLALFLLVIALYSLLGILDYLRGRVAARLGAQFQHRFDRRMFDGVLNHWRLSARGVHAASGMRDLESVQKFLSSPAVFSVFDMPWTPIYILIIWSFHPWLGMFAVGGGVLLVLITWLNQRATQKLEHEATHASRRSEDFSGSVNRQADSVIALGMHDSVGNRWASLRESAISAQMRFSDVTGIAGAATKALRMFLQSAVLALGAYLVLLGELTPGTMIAASILLGRALAPIEQTIGQTPILQRARDGWKNLKTLLSELPAEHEITQLPRPRAHIVADSVSLTAPGLQRPLVRMVSFEVLPGEVVGVIGSTGSGKSTLARGLTGVWPVIGGAIRLDGAALDQYEPQVLGRYLGYLPQEVQLFEGTIKENIARLDENAVDHLVIEAAKKARIHEFIVRLEFGYDTPVHPGSTLLSGGQRQRLGLARALYRDPQVLVLDEPNANLDAEGTDALNAVIAEMKANKKAVIIMAHRPSAIEQADKILIMRDGTRAAFGPKGEILREHVANHAEIVGTTNRGGEAARS